MQTFVNYIVFFHSVVASNESLSRFSGNRTTSTICLPMLIINSKMLIKKNVSNSWQLKGIRHQNPFVKFTLNFNVITGLDESISRMCTRYFRVSSRHNTSTRPGKQTSEERICNMNNVTFLLITHIMWLPAD